MGLSAIKKIYFSQVQAVVENIDKIFNDGEQADRVVDICLKADKKRGSKDRAFIALLTYEVVRWHKKLCAQTNSENPYFLIAQCLKNNQVELPDWKEFSGFKTVEKELSKAEELSVPDWLFDLCVEQLGEEKAIAELQEMNLEAEVYLRLNSAKGSRSSFESRAQKEDLAIEHVKDDAYRLVKRKKLASTEVFQSGWFEVQDLGSQEIVPFLDLNETVVNVADVCAGAGGKALHIASLVDSKVEVLAFDIIKKRLLKLDERAKRAGVAIKTQVIKNENTLPKYFSEKFDRVLIDAPCSGLGVLKRTPGAKWQLTPSFIEEVVETQARILRTYSKTVKKGGKLVYATCSILPEENMQQIESFLKDNDEFELEESKMNFPSEGNGDGFFIARLKRV